jgi:hypothetical protein
VVLTVSTDSGRDGEYFRRVLCVHEELAHVTVEVIAGANPGRDNASSMMPRA